MSTPKSVLITGCSAGGIGSSLAFSFAKRGFLVFATARTPSKIAPKLSSLSNVEVLTLDTTSKASIAAAAEAVSKRTGGTLDYLFNNSGSGLAAPFLDTDLGMGEKLFEVNVWGVMKCIQGFKELLLKAKGTIVNIASIAGVSPNPYQSIYNASKAAIVLFGETLDIELRPFGVTVVTVMAGMIKSSWYQNSMPQLELPEDSLYHPVADAVRFGMEGLGNEKDGMEPDEFAELVIRDVLAGKKVVWRGGLSNMVYWVSNWMPKWVMDKVLWDMSGLKKMDGRQQI